MSATRAGRSATAGAGVRSSGWASSWPRAARTRKPQAKQQARRAAEPGEGAREGTAAAILAWSAVLARRRAYRRGSRTRPGIESLALISDRSSALGAGVRVRAPETPRFVAR